MVILNKNLDMNFLGHLVWHKSPFYNSLTPWLKSIIRGFQCFKNQLDGQICFDRQIWIRMIELSIWLKITVRISLKVSTFFFKTAFKIQLIVSQTVLVVVVSGLYCILCRVIIMGLNVTLFEINTCDLW